MPDTVTSRLFTLKNIALLFALLSTVIGFAGLSGWLLDNYFLKSFLSDGATMKINTALLMILGGVSLFLSNKGYVHLARLFSGLMIILSLAIIVEHLFGLNLHIDQIWIKDLTTDPKQEAPGRTSLLTALNVFLIGSGVTLLTARKYHVAQLFASCVFILVYLSLMGHLFHISGFYHLGKYSGIAFHTALALLLLAIGSLISEPRRGWVSTIYERLFTENLLIYVLSYFLGAAPLLAALYLFVIQNGSLSPASGIVVLVTLSALAILPVAYFLLRLVNRMGSDLKMANQELAAANEELAASNEELRATNEELVSTNEELVEAQENLQLLLEKFSASEGRFRYLVKQAPVAIYILKGKDLVSELANDRMLSIIGKQLGDILGVPFKDAIPELANQPFLSLLERVYQNGETYYGNEQKATLQIDGRLTEGYFNFIYQPFKNEQDAVSGIMIVATEVTELVTERQERERAEGMLHMAIEAARIGYWHIEPETKGLQYNPMLATIFGYEADTPMTYEQAIAQVTEEHRSRIVAEIEKAIISSEDYDITYAQRRFNDGEVIWLRSIGKITADKEGKHTIFSGIVMDVTEQKTDDLRKNDFIGMVSHELKTPLTSLTSIVQVLNMKLKSFPDSFIPGALSKADTQVRKMRTMINGFLNVSRLESGKLLINRQGFDLDHLLVELCKETELIFPGHSIQYKPCGPIMINADREKIESVISNLLSNAIKYSPKGSLIDVICELAGNNVQVSINDQGMGIKKEDQNKIFDRYFRLESNPAHISGFGIGLYLSAEIIERHQGNIGVESEPGEGSTFYFTLPIIKD